MKEHTPRPPDFDFESVLAEVKGLTQIMTQQEALEAHRIGQEWQQRLIEQMKEEEVEPATILMAQVMALVVSIRMFANDEAHPLEDSLRMLSTCCTREITSMVEHFIKDR